MIHLNEFIKFINKNNANIRIRKSLYIKTLVDLFLNFNLKK